MTYFININNKKKYIYEFIKDNNKLRDLDFWIHYAKLVVNLDIQNNVKKDGIISEKKEKMKVIFAAFSNILTIANNMVNFGLDEDLINNFIAFGEKNFSLSKDQINQIKELMVVWTANVEKTNTEEPKEEKKEEEKKEDTPKNDNEKEGW